MVGDAFYIIFSSSPIYWQRGYIIPAIETSQSHYDDCAFIIYSKISRSACRLPSRSHPPAFTYLEVQEGISSAMITKEKIQEIRRRVRWGEPEGELKETLTREGYSQEEIDKVLRHRAMICAPGILYLAVSFYWAACGYG